METRTMKGAVLPGNSTVELKVFEIPRPGYAQVLIKTKATTICGSDIRCIYREHVGKGPEAYIPGMIAGHEPCGQIVEEGEGLRRFKKGDRVIVYHISGCGVCNDCRRGQSQMNLQNVRNFSSHPRYGTTGMERDRYWISAKRAFRI